MVVHLSVVCPSEPNAPSAGAFWPWLSGKTVRTLNSFWSVSFWTRPRVKRVEIRVRERPVTACLVVYSSSAIKGRAMRPTRDPRPPFIVEALYPNHQIFSQKTARRPFSINFTRTRNAGPILLSHLPSCPDSTLKKSVVSNQLQLAAQSMSALFTAASMWLVKTDSFSLIMTSSSSFWRHKS